MCGKINWQYNIAECIWSMKVTQKLAIKIGISHTSSPTLFPLLHYFKIHRDGDMQLLKFEKMLGDVYVLIVN